MSRMHLIRGMLNFEKRLEMSQPKPSSLIGSLGKDNPDDDGENVTWKNNFAFLQ